MKFDFTLFKSKNRDGGAYYDKSLPPSMSTGGESNYGTYFGPAPKNGKQQTFGYHDMTDVEISYLRGLVREYKHVSTHPARREEIWRALNWAPLLHQFINVIHPPNDTPTFNNRLDLIKWKLNPLSIGFTDTTVGDLEREMEAVLVMPRLEYVMFKKDFVKKQPNEYYLNSAFNGTLQLTKNIRGAQSLNFVNFDFIKSMINQGILTYAPTFVLPVHPNLPWEDSLYTSPFNFSGFNKDDSFFFTSLRTTLSTIDVPAVGPSTTGKTYGFSKPLDYGSVGDLDQIINKKIYNNKRISDQELVFYIRLKYGFAFLNPDTELAAVDKITPSGFTMPPKDNLIVGESQSKEYIELYKELNDKLKELNTSDPIDENIFVNRNITVKYYSVMFFNDELERHANHGEQLITPVYTDAFGVRINILKDKNIPSQITDLSVAAAAAESPAALLPVALTYPVQVESYNIIISQIISANKYLKEVNKKGGAVLFYDSATSTILHIETDREYVNKILYTKFIKNAEESEEYLKLQKIPYAIKQTGTIAGNIDKQVVLLASYISWDGSKWPPTTVELDFALPSWNQLIPMSTILAYWRAHKLLQNLEAFSRRLEQALKDKTALAVVGNVTPPSDKNSDLKNIKKTSQELFFISGTSVPSGHPDDERPWRHLFERANHEFGSSFYDKDREVRNPTNSCIPTKQYMRHQLHPPIEMYISKYLYDDTELLATKLALDKIYGIHSVMVKHYFGDDGLPEILRVYLYTPKIGKTITKKEYNIITKTLKQSKEWVFWVIYTCVVLFELLAGMSSLIKTLFSQLAIAFEKGLTVFKTTANISLEYWNRLIIDLILGIIGIRLMTLHAHPIVGITITLSAMLGYKIYDAFEEQKLRENFLKLVEEATTKNVIEGPYAESDGVIEISKSKNGQIPIRTKYNKDTQKWENEYESFQVVSDKPQTLEEINREFLLPGGDGDKKFFNQLTCDEKNQILRIANANVDPNTGELRGGKYNPILNSSPNHYDVGAFKLVSGASPVQTVGGVDEYGFYIAFPHWDNQNVEEDDTRRLTKNNRGTPEKNETSTVTFRYFLSKIEKSDDLSPYFKKQKDPTLADFSLILSRDDQRRGRRSGSIVKKVYDRNKPLTDKEIIWLIRRKYKLDRVVDFKDCCSMFNIPVNDQTYPSNTDCQYMIDFTSSEFIQRVIDSPACNNSDKNPENAIPEDDRSSTYQPVNQHGMVEEAKVKKTINEQTKKNEEEDRKQKKKDRRTKKRKQTKKVPPREEGSNDLQHNLNNFPKPGLTPQIPGTNNLGLPTDASNTQTINYETLVNSDTSVGRKLGNLAISLASGYVQDAIDSEYVDVYQYTSSTPLTSGANIFKGRIKAGDVDSFVRSIYSPGYGVIIKYNSRKSYVRLLSDLSRDRFG